MSAEKQRCKIIDGSVDELMRNGGVLETWSKDACPPKGALITTYLGPEKSQHEVLEVNGRRYTIGPALNYFCDGRSVEPRASLAGSAARQAWFTARWGRLLRRP